jgi:hypothetical protein
MCFSRVESELNRIFLGTILETNGFFLIEAATAAGGKAAIVVVAIVTITRNSLVSKIFKNLTSKIIIYGKKKLQQIGHFRRKSQNFFGNFHFLHFLMACLLR